MSEMGQVLVMPGVELTPRVLLAKLLGNVENIAHMAVVRLDKDNCLKLAYTTGMDCGDIAIAALLLQNEVTERFSPLEDAKPSTDGGDAA